MMDQQPMTTETYDGKGVAHAITLKSRALGRWIVDDQPAPEFPIYTRGNIGEVFPDVVKPFSWSLWGIPYSEPGWRAALVNLGAFDMDEFPSATMAMLGVFGGYGYLNVTASRIFGARAPGLSPEAIDQSFFGEQTGVPPYAPRATDESPRHTAQLAQTIGWVLTTDRLPELDAMRAEAIGLRDARPDLSQMSDGALIDRTRMLATSAWYPFWVRHIMATYHSMIPAGAIQGVCAAVGRPDLAADILTSDLPVDSALPAKALWALSRKVRDSHVLSALFDAGVEGLASRLESSDEPGVVAFRNDWKGFIGEYGFRGPNEWEMASEVWEISPAAPLAALASQRRSEETSSPGTKKAVRDAAREQAIAAVETLLAADQETLGQFRMAARAAAVFFAGRERTRSNCAIVTHEMRMPMYELGRRFVERGVFEQASDFALLTDAEWSEALSDVSQVPALVAGRKVMEARLAALTPPFIVDGVVPPLDTWAPRGRARTPLAPGETITGQPGCAGIVRGIARVVLDPSDPGDLEPGDILIARHTDPSWTPIFAAVSGVVVNVGATISHAVIVARELGVPCVVSADGATDRIESGALIEVNGSAGTVTLITPAGAIARETEQAPAVSTVREGSKAASKSGPDPGHAKATRKPWWKLW